MKHLDITIDIETTSLDVTAAIMQLGAVAWNRQAETSDDIFILKNEDGTPSAVACEYFNMGVDLRTSFIAGLDFDKSTARWWDSQNEDVKKEMLSPSPIPVETVLEQFASWVQNIQKRVGAESVTIWSQGADFDCAILRHISGIFHVKLPVRYQNFRCARTYAQEIGALLLNDPLEAAKDPYKVYSVIPEYPGKKSVHDALYDSCRTAWTTWHFMHGVKK